MYNINSWVLYLIPILDSLLVFLKVSLFCCFIILTFILVNVDAAESLQIGLKRLIVAIVALATLLLLIPSSDTAIKLYLNNNDQSIEQIEKNLKELVDGSKKINELIKQNQTSEE